MYQDALLKLTILKLHQAHQAHQALQLDSAAWMWIILDASWPSSTWHGDIPVSFFVEMAQYNHENLSLGPASRENRTIKRNYCSSRYCTWEDVPSVDSWRGRLHVKAKQMEGWWMETRLSILLCHEIVCRLQRPSRRSTATYPILAFSTSLTFPSTCSLHFPFIYLQIAYFSHLYILLIEYSFTYFHHGSGFPHCSSEEGPGQENSSIEQWKCSKILRCWHGGYDFSVYYFPLDSILVYANTIKTSFSK